MSKLKKQKKILEDNIKMEKDMVKNNKSYTGPNGKTYGPDHYKKALQYDQEELAKVKGNLKRTQQISRLKDAASNAINGHIDGIKSTVSAANKIADKINKPIADTIMKNKDKITSTMRKVSTEPLTDEIKTRMVKAGSEGTGAGAIIKGLEEAKRRRGGIR